MKVAHHGIEAELFDTWWSEANMEGFTPSTKSFCVDLSRFTEQDVFEVYIPEIGPVVRAPGVGIFNNNEKATAQERVVSILRAIRSDTALPPVEVVCAPEGAPYRYKLTAGYHRLYCAVACGFTHIPAVFGFDPYA
jgi:hypothetical protein